MKTGIFYATSGGTTEDVAKKIGKALGVAESDVRDVRKVSPVEMASYDFIIAGSPTYGSGELQDDWYDMLDAVKSLDLTGKKVAVFGVGDESMSDTFCDAAGIIYGAFKLTGANMVGDFNTFPYEFNESKAVKIEGAGAVGLLIDDVNHADVTDERVEEWVKTLK